MARRRRAKAAEPGSVGRKQFVMAETAGPTARRQQRPGAAPMFRNPPAMVSHFRHFLETPRPRAPGPANRAAPPAAEPAPMHRALRSCEAAGLEREEAVPGPRAVPRSAHRVLVPPAQERRVCFPLDR
ncbi:MAG: hypothetical protein DCC65_01965 [Planctomycetota bacterium]|nr:MAG: hypothetical protein DCC65_01965 [Planctomycetota bacterium]